MTRSIGYLSVLLAVGLTVAGNALQRPGFDPLPFVSSAPEAVIVKGLFTGAILFGAYGLHRLLSTAIRARTASKRRQHDVGNVLQLVFGVAAVIGIFGVVTEQWVGVLFSLGVVGFAVTGERRRRRTRRPCSASGGRGWCR